MTLIKWKPRPMSIFDDMDNMVNSVFNTDWNLPAKVSSKWSPAVDVNETDNAFTITADMPGLVKKDIEVNISNDVLTISGERAEDTDQTSNLYHYRERAHGSFVRTFNLPESVNEKKVTAKFKDGILKIELPKLETVLSTKREIKIN